MTNQKIPFKRLLAAILLLIPFFISGCIKEEMGSTTINSTFNLKVQNAEGQDLLNPATEGYLSIDYINLFYVKDGKEVFQYVQDENGIRKGMSIHHNETSGEYYLSVQLSLDDRYGEISTNIIKMHGYPADTLKAEIRKRTSPSGGSTSWSYSKVWINGEEFDLSTGEKAVLIKGVN